MPDVLRIARVPAQLGRPAVPGSDLVLELDERTALDLPSHTLADDFLDVRERRAIDRALHETLAEWRAAFDDAFTLDGICFPWIWELDLGVRAILPTIWRGRALARALEELRPAAVELVADDASSVDLVRAVAHPLEVEVRSDRGRGRSDEAGAAQVSRVGVPSRLRRGSVVVAGYWNLEGVFDELLRRREAPPAVCMQARPGGFGRAARGVLRGGLLGRPGRSAVTRANRRLADVVDAAETPPDLEVLGLPLGRCVHAEILAHLRRRGGLDLANAATIRAAFRRRRPSWVVVPNDHVPFTRLLVHLAREAGVRSLGVQHGAYLPPHEGEDAFDERWDDLEACDEAAVWSDTAAAAILRPRGPVHVVGYPGGPAAGSRSRAAGSGRVLVFPQGPLLITSLVPARMKLEHCAAAVRAATRSWPGATVTVRPHPSHDLEPYLRLREHLGVDLVLDRETEIVELVRRHDVCVGAWSTVVFQAALVGTPIVILNLTGFDWNWPLGGRTPVAVARSEDELAELLARVREHGPGAGSREALLEALGAGRSGAAGRIAAILTGHATSTRSRSRPN